MNDRMMDVLLFGHQLASVSDVLVENYLPGKLSAMGLGFEQLHPLNPGLVYCSITGIPHFFFFFFSFYHPSSISA